MNTVVVDNLRISKFQTNGCKSNTNLKAGNRHKSNYTLQA